MVFLKNGNLVPRKLSRIKVLNWNYGSGMTKFLRVVKNMSQNIGKVLPKYIYHVDTKKCILVSPPEMEDMYSPTCDEYNYVIIGDKRPYRRLADWRDGEASDLYLVNLETGERKLLFSVS